MNRNIFNKRTIISVITGMLVITTSYASSTNQDYLIDDGPYGRKLQISIEVSKSDKNEQREITKPLFDDEELFTNAFVDGYAGPKQNPLKKYNYSSKVFEGKSLEERLKIFNDWEKAEKSTETLSQIARKVLAGKFDNKPWNIYLTLNRHFNWKYSGTSTILLTDQFILFAKAGEMIRKALEQDTLKLSEQDKKNALILLNIMLEQASIASNNHKALMKLYKENPREARWHLERRK